MSALKSAAAKRGHGYLEAVLKLADVDGEIVRMSDADYAAIREKYQRTGNADTHGPGTELKKLLSRLGFSSTPTCSCNKRAQVMDEKGVQWCEENVDTVCDWLAEEAGKRKLPFIRSAGKLLIRMAIRNAKKGISQ